MASTAPPPAPVDDAATKKNMASALGLKIAPARCLSHLTKAYEIPKEVKEQTKAAREQVKAAKAALITAKGRPGSTGKKAVAAAVKQISATEGALEALTKDQVRIGAEVKIATAATADWIATKLANAALGQTLANKKKRVEIHALHEAAGENAAVFELVRNLDLWKTTATEISNDTQATIDHAVAAAAAIKAGDEPEKPEATTGTAAEEVAAATPNKLRFTTYVEAACKQAKADTPEFNTLCFSKKFRSYVSGLLEQFMDKFAGLFKRVLAGSHVRTLSAGNITLVLDLILQHAGFTEAAAEVIAAVNEKVDAWEKMTKADSPKADSPKGSPKGSPKA